MKLARFTIDSDDWGQILVMRPVPRGGDPWGDLAPLRETPWGDLITIVSGESLSFALHGDVTVLMREIGPHPRGLSKKVPKEYRWCTLHKSGCLTASDKCEPGPNLPFCYSPPNLPEEARLPAAAVALAWQEGRYVVVVEGQEFSL